MNEPKTALILSHGTPQPGREREALQLQGRFLAHVRALRDSQRVHDARAYILITGATHSRKGMLVIEGTREAVDEIFWSKEWKALVAQASALTHDVQLDLAVGGVPESLAGPSHIYAEAIQALGR